jgi:formylglycine-generating enzyme required for sulfatase activity
MRQKWFLVFILVSMILALLSGCSESALKPEEALWGHWAYAGTEGGSLDYAFDLSFQEDGTLSRLSQPQYVATYVVIAPGRMKLTMGSSSVVLNYSLDENTLTLYFGEGHNTYTRAPETRPIAPGELTETVIAIDEIPLPTNTDISTASQMYRFVVRTMEVEAYIEEDGTLSLWYLFDFQNNADGKPLDYVDIGLPKSAYNLNDIQAEVNGKAITKIEHSPYAPNGFELELGADAIQPGQSGSVTAWIPGIRNVRSVHDDLDRENYFYFQFSPNWFDSDFGKSTSTDYRVTIILPPDVDDSEAVYFEPQRWPGPVTPDHDGRTTAEGRIYYSWFSNTANAHTQYVFGVAFPDKYVSDGAIATHPTPIAPPNLEIGSTMVNPADGSQMVYVPEGEFIMGSDPGGGPYYYGAESPSHEVYLDAFWIYQTEVTNQQFSQFVNETGYLSTVIERGWGHAHDGSQWTKTTGANWKAPGGPGSSIVGKENHPVVQISWFDANAYCQWANGRLPTEAEWEKAARGTDGRLYPYGNTTPTCNIANFLGCVGGTMPVGSYPNGISPYGALDMLGNVWEWVEDWFQNHYYQISPDDNPPGPASGSEKVFRGGSWSNSLKYLNLVYRNRHIPQDSHGLVGFRCVFESIP